MFVFHFHLRKRLLAAGAAAVMGNFLDKIIGKEVDGWAEEKTAREA